MKQILIASAALFAISGSAFAADPWDMRGGSLVSDRYVSLEEVNGPEADFDFTPTQSITVDGDYENLHELRRFNR